MWNRLKRKIKPKSNTAADLIARDKLPIHVAIITDGNGRWAKKRGLPRTFGHAAGVKRVREIIEASSLLGIKVLTYYAFSTENWKRPSTEVNYLMRLPVEMFVSEINSLMQNNIKVKILGDKTRLPEQTKEVLDKFEDQTQSNTGMLLNLAINYGARDEIISVFQKILQKFEGGTLRSDDIDQALFEQHLLTAGIPDPDLVIRTSGECRLSNFLLWQIAYSELLFTDTLWPDFNKEQFYKAILQYQNRSRRYGDIIN